jgi:hypothetical protein
MMSNAEMKDTVAKKHQRSELLTHPKMYEFLREQELIKAFMLALAPAYHSDDDCSAQDVRFLAEDLAFEFINGYKQYFPQVEDEIEKELESK